MPTWLYRWSYTRCSQFERPMLSPLVLLLYHLIVLLLYRLIFVNLWLWRNLLHAIAVSRMNTMTAFLWTFPTVTHYLTMSSFVCDQRMQAKSFNSTHTTVHKSTRQHGTPSCSNTSPPVTFMPPTVNILLLPLSFQRQIPWSCLGG